MAGRDRDFNGAGGYPVLVPPRRPPPVSGLATLLLAALVATTACRSWPEESVARERELFELINEVRAGTVTCPTTTVADAEPLAWDESLAWAARLHAEDMGRQNYFDHTSLDGRAFTDRIAAEGYGGVPRAENLAAGSSDPETTLGQWLASDGHCRNLADVEATCAGVGYVADEDSEWGHYWVFVSGIR